MLQLCPVSAALNEGGKGNYQMRLHLQNLACWSVITFQITYRTHSKTQILKNIINFKTLCITKHSVKLGRLKIEIQSIKFCLAYSLFIKCIFMEKQVSLISHQRPVGLVRIHNILFKLCSNDICIGCRYIMTWIDIDNIIQGVPKKMPSRLF